METFEKNLETLKKYHPLLYNQLPITHYSLPITHYQLLKSRSGHPTVKYKGIFLASQYDPRKEAKRWVENISSFNNRFLIVLGFGLGYHLKEIRRQATHKCRYPGIRYQVLVVEQELELFFLALSLLDFSNLLSDPQITLKVGYPEEEVISFFKESFSFLSFWKAQILEHPSSLRLNPAYYQGLRKRLTESIEQEKTRSLTLAKFGRVWQENILANLPWVISFPSVTALFSRFSSCPAIIVSAGPSLDKNVEELKEVGNKALIISTDTALRALFNHQINPHLIVSIDPQEINFKRFTGLSLSDGYLVAAEIANFRTLRLEAKKFISLSDHPFTTYIFRDKEHISTAGGCVATFAFDLARKLGCSPIVLIGQDLAYTNSLSYTRTTHNLEEISKFKTLEMKEWEEIRRRDLLEIEGINGGKVLTDYVLWGYLKWFEKEIARSRDLKIINATEGGAKISGAQTMSLKEALKTYCLKEIQIKEVLERAYQNRTGRKKDELLLGLKRVREEITNYKLPITIIEPLLYETLFDSLHKRREANRETLLSKATKEAFLLMKEMLGKTIEDSFFYLAP